MFRFLVRRFVGSKGMHGGTLNYFDILKVPVAFNIDMEDLQRNFKSLQKTLHPDVSYASSKALPVSSVPPSTISTATDVDSSTVNHAYQVLKKPADRVAHLLKVLGVSGLSEGDVLHDPSIAANAFVLRESIEELKSCDDARNAIEMHKDIHSQLMSEGANIQKYLDQKQWDQLKSSSIWFIYLSKALEEADAVIENFEKNL